MLVGLGCVSEVVEDVFVGVCFVLVVGCEIRRQNWQNNKKRLARRAT